MKNPSRDMLSFPFSARFPSRSFYSTGPVTRAPPKRAPQATRSCPQDVLRNEKGTKENATPRRMKSARATKNEAQPAPPHRARRCLSLAASPVPVSTHETRPRPPEAGKRGESGLADAERAGERRVSFSIILDHSLATSHQNFHEYSEFIFTVHMHRMDLEWKTSTCMAQVQRGLYSLSLQTVYV